MQSKQPFISLCMIVGNDSELTSLSKAIQSAEAYVDEVCITANGNDTKKIEAYCKNNFYKYSYLAWDDNFAEQRNYNFAQANPKADYILWLDSDDELVGGEHLKWLATKTLAGDFRCVFLPYWYSCSFDGEPSINTLKKIDLMQKRERLMTPNYYNWVGRLHETPIAKSSAKDKYTLYDSKDDQYPIIAVMHRSIKHDVKSERNMRIMKKQLADEIATREGGADPRTLLYLLKMFAENANTSKEDLELGIQYGKEYLQKSGWDEERASCNEHMGLCYQGLGKDSQAVECFEKAIQEFPFQPMLYLRLATIKYNQGKYLEAKHWLKVATSIDLGVIKTSGITNVQGMKVIASELAMRLAYNVDKDIDASTYFAKKLYEANPTTDTDALLLEMENKQAANNAVKKYVDVIDYFIKADEIGIVNNLLDTLPEYFKSLPVFLKMRNKFKKPVVWDKQTICYFANFGNSHFEKWDEDSLSSGIGGSETAVIRLSQEWVKKGYRVVVYGDPNKVGVRDGIDWQPYYNFNIKDRFGIFIQWRNWSLAPLVKADKFYVDLHDIYSPLDLTDKYVKAIDKIMVKSKYHRDLAPNVPDDKFVIISNGI